QRDAAKHDRMLDFADVLPTIRASAVEHLSARGYGRERVLAAAVRLIDLGFFRAGGEAYAVENQTYGVATVLREHVRCHRGEVVFEYSAKGAVHREQAIAEEAVCAVVTGLRRRKTGGPELLAYRSATGWHDVTARDINM